VVLEPIVPDIVRSGKQVELNQLPNRIVLLGNERSVMGRNEVKDKFLQSQPMGICE